MPLYENAKDIIQRNLEMLKNGERPNLFVVFNEINQTPSLEG